MVVGGHQRQKEAPGLGVLGEPSPLGDPSNRASLGQCPIPAQSHEGGSERGVGGVAVPSLSLLCELGKLMVSPGKRARISWLPGSTW